MPYKYNSCFPQLPNGHFSCGILWQTVSAFFCNSVFYLVISMDIPGEMKFQSAKVLQKTPPKQILQKKMSLGKRPAVAIHGNMEIVQQKCPNGCFSSSRRIKTLQEIHDSIEQCRKNVQMDIKPIAIHGKMEIVQQKCPNGCFSSCRNQKTLKEIHDSIEQCRKNVQMEVKILLFRNKCNPYMRYPIKKYIL